MKYSMNKLFSISLVSLALLAAGCGGKKKNVASGGGWNVSPFSSGSGVAGVTGEMISQVNSIKNQVSCSYGRQRLNRDYTFYTTNFTVGNNGMGTAVMGNFTPGIVPGGTITRLYVGVDPYNRDIMFVSKVTNGGGQVIGYNVTLSYCEMPNPNIPSAPPIITSAREVSAFQTNGLVLDEDAYCGYGVIDYSKVAVMFQPYQSYQSFVAWGLFTKPSCNGKY